MSSDPSQDDSLTPIPPSSAEPTFPDSSTEEVDPKADRLGYLHWSSIFFDLVSIIRQNLWQIVVTFVLGQTFFWGQFIVWILVISIVTSTIYQVYRYLTLRYRVANKKLVIEQGLIFKTIRTIPIEKIQNLDLVQQVLHRFFRVAEVRIETAGGTGVEAVLRVITLQQVEELKQWIFVGTPSKLPNKNLVDQTGTHDLLPDSQANNNDEIQTGIPIAAGTAGHPQAELAHAGTFPQNGVNASQLSAKEILRIPYSQLIKAGVSSNQGFILIGIAVSAIYQFGSDNLDMLIPSDWMQKYEWLKDIAWDKATPTEVIGVVAVAIVALFLITRITGALWYLIRFGGYRLTRMGDDFQVSFGLWTRISATVPRHRIQFVSVHRPFFFRFFGLSVIRIETAGGSDESNKSAGVVRECFVPVIPDDQVAAVLEEIRPNLVFPSTEENSAEDSENWVGLSPLATRRKLRRSFAVGLLGVVIASIFSWTQQHLWAFVPFFIIWPPIVYWAYRSSKTVKYRRTGLGLIYRSGIFNKKQSIAFQDRIQAVSLSQSLFDRRWRMATLSIDTAAAGPAKHTINIEFLDQKFAMEELETIRSYYSNALIPLDESSTQPFRPVGAATA